MLLITAWPHEFMHILRVLIGDNMNIVCDFAIGDRSEVIVLNGVIIRVECKLKGSSLHFDELKICDTFNAIRIIFGDFDSICIILKRVFQSSDDFIRNRIPTFETQVDFAFSNRASIPKLERQLLRMAISSKFF